MKEAIRTQFDKLLLSLLLAVFCGMAVHAYHSTGESGLASFATDQAKTVIGALLGLITGHALAGAAVSRPAERQAEEGEPKHE